MILRDYQIFASISNCLKYSYWQKSKDFPLTIKVPEMRQAQCWRVKIVFLALQTHQAVLISGESAEWQKVHIYEWMYLKI